MVTKDQRKLSIIMRDFDECTQVSDIIKQVTFLDSVEPAERKQQSFFCVSMFDYVTNEASNFEALNDSQAGIFKEDTLTFISKLMEMNYQAWNVYSEPYKEFQRQGCIFEKRVDNGNITLLKKRALFQLFDNSQF